MARVNGTFIARWCARGAKGEDKLSLPVCRQVLKSLKFSRILGGQPVAVGIVFEPPPLEMSA